MKVSIFKSLLVGIGIFALSAFAANAQDTKWSVGVNGLYGTEIKSFAVGAKLQYDVTNHIRLEDAFNYFFKKDGVSMWEENLNVHYLFNITDNLRFYPLAGFTVVGVKFDSSIDIPKEYQQYIPDAGSSSSDIYFGANLGAGIEYLLTSHLAVGVEGKYSLVKDVDQAVFGVGITYKF